MKLIVIDMDGTLLNENHQISLENIYAIQESIKKGNIVAIATGRNYFSAKRLLDEVALNLPIIGSNGGTIHLNNTPLHTILLEVGLTKEILEYISNYRLTAMVSTSKGAFVSHDTIEVLEDELNSTTDEYRLKSKKMLDDRKAMTNMPHLYKPYTDYRELLLENMDIYKVFVYSFIQQKLNAMKNHFAVNKRLYITSSGRNNIEFMPLQAQKSFGVTVLAEKIGVPLKDTIVIGDNYNDLPMFSVAGTSIAMGNAEEDVKKQATYITKTNTEDGVAYALKELI
ncbi:MAG: Cof-type HAD-IIB family hydrolase [Bacillaceae bacterium]